MSDYVFATIEIGGALPAALVGALLEAIKRDGAKADIGLDEPEEVTEDFLWQAHRGKDTLRLMDENANYGAFPEVETFCRQHSLTYSRWSDAKHEYDATQTTWQPGMKDPANFLTNKDRELVAPLSQLEGYVRQGLTLEQVIDRLKAKVVRVPPFEIVE
jgi:hypothetical protein